MLRTMITDAPFEQTWILQGKLCGQWVADLRRQWEEKRNERRGRKCVVNLEDVTCVDREGEELLREILREGAQFVASRAYMKHVVESLNAGKP
ncbi:MAG TPA: hypothetical protein VMB02_11315 [Candidatus Aquilonibacter sp.]|nr:hypothetical protein [Candidatus Aquilonibacter sp.]